MILKIKHNIWDVAQAKALVSMITERLPQFSFDDIKIFPASLVEKVDAL